MAKTSKIVDAVAHAVTGAEIAVVRTGRKVVSAVNRAVGGKRKSARRKTARRKTTARRKPAGRKTVRRTTTARRK
jgi:hypothetical protein